MARSTGEMEQERPTSLGHAIRQERLARGWTQKTVAHKLNTTPNQISAWENGASMSLRQFVAFAWIFDWVLPFDPQGDDYPDDELRPRSSVGRPARPILRLIMSGDVAPLSSTVALSAIQGIRSTDPAHAGSTSPRSPDGRRPHVVRGC